MRAKREAEGWRPSRRRAPDFPRCNAPLATGRPCRLPRGHPETVAHRERLKGAYARAVVKSMTGIDLAHPERTAVATPEMTAAMDTGSTASALLGRISSAEQRSIPSEMEAETLGAVRELAAAVAGLAEQVEQLRFRTLRIDDRLALLATQAGVTPSEPKRDPDLVRALQMIHARVTKLERRNVSTGDWEEAVDTLLDLTRSIERSMRRLAPRVA